MKYKNPIVRGFYPDPSVCYADGKYYMVCSSFQYFPGVPLFESDNLVNWKQIGYVITRKNQVYLENINSSGGIFAPTIRYNDGRFYMVTTNDTTHENFYVYTDDIHGEWSDPITVDQGGIDPSLLFVDGHCYFMSNGQDEEGIPGVIQCEINVETGEKITKSKCIWQGNGGRFLESPHLYHIKGEFYLMAAEGGTEYGHMITYARGKSVWGPFENYPKNPVLTNRNKAPYIIQGIGHGDLICDRNGDWHIVSLGFRQMHIWMAYHTLGREVFLTPVTFGEDGWFTAGVDGTTDECYEIQGDFEQDKEICYRFDNTDPAIDWCYLRHPNPESYVLSKEAFVLRGTKVTLNEAASPTWIGLRQRDFEFDLSVCVKTEGGEGGVCLYMNENEHYDLLVREGQEGYEAVLRLNVGDIHHEQAVVALDNNHAKLLICGEPTMYHFALQKENGETIKLGSAQAKYLSTEVSGGFTGVMTALYAVGNNTVTFTEFHCIYK